MTYEIHKEKKVNYKSTLEWLSPQSALFKLFFVCFVTYFLQNLYKHSPFWQTPYTLHCLWVQVDWKCSSRFLFNFNFRLVPCRSWWVLKILSFCFSGHNLVTMPQLTLGFCCFVFYFFEPLKNLVAEKNDFVPGSNGCYSVFVVLSDLRWASWGKKRENITVKW